MTEDEYNQLRATIERIAEQEKTLKAHAQDAEDSFTPTVNGIIELLGAAKKRLSDRIDGQRPPLNE
jgi:hypothetical protein